MLYCSTRKALIKESASFVIEAIHVRIAMINQSDWLFVQLEIVDLNQGTRVIMNVNNLLSKNEGTFSR